MKRPALLFVLAVLAAAVTGLLLALGSGSGAPPLEPGHPGTGGPPKGDPLRMEASTTAEAPVREAVSQRAGVRAADADLLEDPEIRRALTGFRGRIVDAGGKPVPECGVRILRLGTESLSPPGAGIMTGSIQDAGIVAGETETDTEGRFLVDGVWPRGIYLLLGGLGTDFPMHRILQQTPPPGEIVDLGDVQLAEGAVVTGIVVDEGGEPVAGALVRGVDLPGQLTGMMPLERFDPEGVILVREAGAPTPVIEMPAWVKQVWDNLPIPTTTTDGEGRFRLAGLVPGPNMIAATHPGLLPAVQPSVPLRAGQERDLGRLRLREGEEVIGVVRDTAGRPVAGAEVVAAPTTLIAPVDFGSRIGVTDAEGRFRAGGFPDGKITVAARRGSGEAWVVAQPQSIYQDVAVVLPATNRLDVGLLSETGAELTRPHLRLLPGNGDDGTLEMSILGFLPEIDLADRIEKLEDGRLRITGLASGKYYVMAQAEGHGVGGTAVHLQGDSEVSVTLPLQKQYRVRVVDAEGRGIRNAAVYVRQFGKGTAEMPVHCGRTRPDGRLSVDETYADRIRITAEHPAYGLAHAEATYGAPETILRMETPGAIEGVVTEGGRPPALGTWTVVITRDWQDQQGAHDGMPSMAVPDVEGAFAVRGLQPGSYQVMLIKSLDAVRSFGSVFGLAESMFMAGDLPEVDAQVPAGGVARIRIEANSERTVDGPSARITGTVFVDGATAEGMVMYAWTSDGRFVAKVDSASRFDLGLLPEGHATVTLLDRENMSGFMVPGGGGALWSEDIDVVAGEDRDLQVQVQTGSLAGSVFYEDGSPAAHAWLSANGRTGEEQGSESWFNTSTDSAGRFEFPRVPAGSYGIEARVQVQGTRSARGKLEDVQVVAGLPTRNVRVVVHGTVMVSGRVDLSLWGNDRPNWIGVSFQTTEENGEVVYVDTAGVDDEGNFSTNEILPGTYKLAIHHSGEQGEELVHPDPVVVGPDGLEGLLVRPTPKPSGDGR